MKRRIGLSMAAGAALCLVLLIAPPSAEAGIFDSIKGFFGKASDTVKGWFSGGGTKEFEELLQKVTASQELVAEKQGAVFDYLGRPSASSKDPAFQKSMNELAEASRGNEKLYYKLLTVRQELVDKKRDVSKYSEALSRIQKTQRNLEEGAMAIDRKSKELGAYKPPAQVLADASGGLGDRPWQDPRVQGYIDEWLAANGLNEFGVQLGGVVVASVNPDFDGPRHQWVWEQLQDQRGRRTGNTLAQYVRARMEGASASPAASAEPVTASASSGASGASELEHASASASLGSPQTPAGLESSGGESLETTEKQLKTAMAEYEQMASKGKGNSAEARKLLETIRGLKTRRDRMIAEKRAAAASGR